MDQKKQKLVKSSKKESGLIRILAWVLCVALLAQQATPVHALVSPHYVATKQEKSKKATDSIAQKEDSKDLPASSSNASKSLEAFFTFNQQTQTITGYSPRPDAPKDIQIPQQINGIDVLHIGADAFSGLQLTSLALHEGLLTIGDDAFKNNLFTGVLVIPDSVTRIGSRAFLGLNQITDIQMGSQVQIIGDGAFQDCSQLTQIEIPDSVTTIGKDAFLNTRNLTRINIPAKDFDTITGAPWGATCTVYWRDVVEVDSFLYNKTTQTIIEYVGSSTDVVMPDHFMIDGQRHPVLAFEGNTFKNKNLTSVSLPGTLTEIPSEAFYRMGSLSSVQIGDGIQTIGYRAFDSTNLKEVAIPDSVTQIGNNAFWSSSLEKVSLGSGVKTIGNGAFGHGQYNSIEIPESVQRIGSGAFRSGLGRIDLPKTGTNSISGAPWGATYAVVYWKEVVDIAPFAYNYKTEAIVDYVGTSTDVIVPDHFIVNGARCDVRSFEKSAFSLNRNITSVVLPNTITEIPEDAFYQANSLSRIELPEGLQSIGKNAFSGAYRLVEIRIPKTVTKIESTAFGKDLKEINIPEKKSGSILGAPWGANQATVYWSDVVKVDPFVFDTSKKQIVAYQGSGGDVVMPGSFDVGGVVYDVESFTTETFGDRGNASVHGREITSITLPNTLTEIPIKAFYNCVKLKEITIPETVTTIGGGAFYGTSALQWIYIPGSDNGQITFAPWGADGSVPIYWRDTVEINDFVFHQSTGEIVKYIGNSTDVIVPESFTIGGVPYEVTKLSGNLFRGNRQITSVVLPDTVKAISISFFENCSSLESVRLPDGLETIRSNSFRGAGSLTNVTIPRNLKTIENNAFENCRSLKSIVIPESVTWIRGEAFLNSGLQSVDIPKSVVTIEGRAFKGTPLQSLDFPGTVESMGDNVFEGTRLEDVTIEEGAKTLGSKAFLNVKTLKSVTVPSTMKNWSGAFQGCTSLTSVVLPEGIEIIGSAAFSDCASLVHIVLPSTVKTIDHYAFKGTGLSQIKIPEGVETIGSYAFSETALQSVVVPDRIQVLGSDAFYGCTNLEEITLSANLKSLETNYFRGVPKLKKIVVMQQRDTSPIKGNQPWGATSASVFYLGEFVEFDHTVGKVAGNYEREIHIWATSDKAHINRVILPDGTMIHVGDIKWPGSGTYTYKVTQNGTYTFKGYTSSGDERIYEVVIDDIGKPEIVANDGIINLTNVPTATKDDIYKIINASVKDELDQDVPFEISDRDLAKVHALSKRGDVARVTVVATSKFGLTAQKTVSITVKTTSGVTFEANGGAPVPANQQVFVGDLVAEPQNPSKQGYQFDQWYVDSTLTTPWDFTSDLMEENDITLYAGYTANPYTVIFHANGGTGTMVDQTLTYDTAENLTKNSFTRAGYTFKGWMDTANASVVTYTDEAEVKNLVEQGFVTLYALWEADENPVLFEANGGTPEPASQQVKTDALVTKPTDPTKVGYTFEGWYSDTTPPRLWDFDNHVVGAGGMTLSAHYTANPYTVIFDGNGGIGAMADQALTYDTAANLTKNRFTRVGYTFKGWADTANASAVVYTDEAKVKNLVEQGSVTLYAVWEANENPVVFEANGGTPTPVEQLVRTDALVTKPATDPTKYGYTFEGWYRDAGLTTLWDFDNHVVGAGGVTLYAGYTVNPYTVTFDGNGGSGIMADQDFIYDVKEQLDANTFTKTGYTFMGWAKTAGATTAEYANQEEVMNLIGQGNITLYAVWKANSYTVTFDGNGGTGTMADQAFVFDLAQALSHNQFNKVGYTFKGWSSTPGGSIAYQNGEHVKNLVAVEGGTTTLYAVWEINTYSILVEDSTQTQKEVIDNIEYGKTITILDPNGGMVNGKPFVVDGSFTTLGIPKVEKKVVMGMTITEDGNGNKIVHPNYVNLYTVNFVDYDGSVLTPSQEVLHGESAKAPGNLPTRKGYTFRGWDQSLTNITEDKTITAQYDINQYDIPVYDADGVNHNEIKGIEYGKTITILGLGEGFVQSHPVKFTVDESFNFVTIPEIIGKEVVSASVRMDSQGNAIVQPSYIDRVYTITVQVSGSGYVSGERELRITHGGSQNYTFTPANGYYVSSVFVDGRSIGQVESYYFDYVTKDHTLSVSFDEGADIGTGGGSTGGGDKFSQFTLRYEVNGGHHIPSKRYEEGTTVDLGVIPEREGFDFLGWYLDASLTEEISFIEMDGNKTVYAKWEKLPIDPQVPLGSFPVLGQSPSFDVPLGQSQVLMQTVTQQNQKWGITAQKLEKELVKEEVQPKRQELPKEAEQTPKQKQSTVATGALNDGEEKVCHTHTFLWVATGIMGLFLLIKRRKNQKELEELQNQSQNEN